MTDFIEVPITVDTESLQDDAVAYVQDKVAGYTLNPAHPMTWLIEATGRNAAEVAAIVARMPPAAFRYLGESVYGIPPNDGTPAIAITTWTAADTLGHTIPAGTQIVIDDRAFATDSLATIAPGASSVTGVAVTAVLDGADGNGLGPAAEPVDAFPWLDTVAVVGTTSGGTDAESDADYQGRLAKELALQAPRPITASDYEKFAKRIPEVDRALAIDGFNIAHNLLTINQSSLETDATGWVAGTDTTIARSTAQASDGVASLAVTKTVGTGNAIAIIATGTGGVPVTQGTTYYVSYEVRSAVTPRVIGVRYAWYDAAGTLIGSVTDATYNSGLTSDTTSGWTKIAHSVGPAPTGAAFLSFGPRFLSAVLSEVHYVDKIAVQLVDNLSWAVGGNAALDMPRRVTVVPVKADGQPISTGAKTALVDMFTALREVNFIVSVLDPTYTLVAVVATVKAYSGFDLPTVDAAVEAAVLSYLSPANWGVRPYGDERVWDSTPVVRYNKLIQIIENVDGVNYVSSLTINGTATDFTLPGVIGQMPSISSTASATVTY
jgi:hypothetical protein